MNEHKSFTEYVVRPSDTAKIRFWRVMLVTIYTVLSAAYLFIFGLLLHVVALVVLYPFLLYALINLTWRFTRTEYEYSIEANMLTIAAIYGGATRRVKCRVDLSDATLIAPHDDSRRNMLEKANISEIKRFAQEDSQTAFVCVWNDKKHERKCAVIFETTDDAKRLLRLANPGAFTLR